MIDQDLFSAVQDVLMEPTDGGQTFPSGLWTRTEVLARANERQNRLLKSTLLQVGSADIPATAGVVRYALPDDWLTTVSVVWIGSDGTIRELTRSDSFEADHGSPQWTTTRATPLFYMDEDSPLLTIQIGPPPDLNGTLQLLYIPQGAPLTGLGELTAVPDEFVLPVLKYGLLADLFGKDGRGKNPEKAAYAEQRFALGIELAGIILRGWC